jgi:GntR family transcriptional regulator
MSAAAVFSAQSIGPASAAPLYLRLKRLVTDAIIDGRLKPGDALPSERSIADLMAISRVTVRSAFGELVNEGLLVQKRGSGTYVNGAGALRIEQPLSRLTSFTEDMALRGLAATSEWLDRSRGAATPEEAIKLSLSPGQLVTRLNRLRRADGMPLAIERATVPTVFLPDPGEVTGSLYTVLERRGLKPVRALQRLHAVALTARDAKHLGVDDGSPALFVERISYLADGRIVEFVKSVFRGDRYDFVAELTLATGDRA